jgi:undecaprenyl diphosphate synthase
MTTPARTNDITFKTLPRHVAMIMDGNGRWANGRGLPRFAGHKQGAKTVDLVTTECARLGL